MFPSTVSQLVASAMTLPLTVAVACGEDMALLVIPGLLIGSLLIGSLLIDSLLMPFSFIDFLLSLLKNRKKEQSMAMTYVGIGSEGYCRSFGSVRLRCGELIGKEVDEYRSVKMKAGSSGKWCNYKVGREAL